MSLPDIARVQTIKILAVTICNRLSVNQYVMNVIASSGQDTLRVLRVHGLNNDALDAVFKAVVAKLTYACGMPHLVGIHHGPRPAENGVCHPPWCTLRLLHHQPGSSGRTRRSS